MATQPRNEAALSPDTSATTVELHLSGLIWTPSHPDMKKIKIIGFFLEYMLHGSMKFGCYYLQYVQASEPSDDALFDVLEAITLFCTRSANR